MKYHILKTDPGPFNAVWNNLKPWELRRDDRGFEVGDKVILRERRGRDRFSGREITANISYILKGAYGLPRGFCIMTLYPIMERKEAP